MKGYLRVVVMAVAALSLCVGCVSLPDGGDVHVGGDDVTTSQDSGYPYDPRPPQQGEDPTEIVGHFLDAMMANPPTTIAIGMLRCGLMASPPKSRICRNPA